MSQILKGQCPRCKGHMIEGEKHGKNRYDVVVYCLLCGRNPSGYIFTPFDANRVARVFRLVRAQL